MRLGGCTHEQRERGPSHAAAPIATATAAAAARVGWKFDDGFPKIEGVRVRVMEMGWVGKEMV